MFWTKFETFDRTQVNTTLIYILTKISIDISTVFEKGVGWRLRGEFNCVNTVSNS